MRGMTEIRENQGGNDGNVRNQGGNEGNRGGNHFSDYSLKNEIIKVKQV